VIVGSGPLEALLRSEVAELALEDIVTFAGHQSDDRLQQWYRAADVFVLPTVAYEGCGMVTLEALASGTPVVGTPIGATPELLAPLDDSLVAASSDPGDLAAAIERVVTADAEDLRHRCRLYATRRFRWSSAIESWETALTEVASRPEVADAVARAPSH
jgi:glycosyltransferase involved in cell wall biosynthesis